MVESLSPPLFTHSYSKLNLKTTTKSLHETLIDELHNHIYLKSPYSMDRLGHIIASETEGATRTTTSSRSTFTKRPGTSGGANANTNNMGKKSDKPLMNENDELIEDLEINPEADSYYYMRILVESLRLLGKLPEALIALQQRIPMELYYLLERTVDELEPTKYLYRKPRHQLKSFSTHNKFHHQPIPFPDLVGSTTKEEFTGILLKLFQLIFDRLEAIIQSHGFVLDCIEKRKNDTTVSRGSKDTEEQIREHLYTVADIWSVAKNEFKALLFDYLLPLQRVTPSSYGAPMIAFNEILASTEKGKKRAAREKNKQLFRVAFGTSQIIQDLYKDIESSATASSGVPLPQGMSYMSSQQPQQLTMTNTGSSFIAPNTANVTSNDVKELASSSNVLDPFKSSTGHKLLIEPDPYYVLVTHKPACDFFDKMSAIVGGSAAVSSNEDELRNYLDEFVQNTFLPTIEDKIVNYFHQYINCEDAFTTIQTDLCPYPLTKSSLACVNLLQSMCSTLSVLPFYRREYVEMVDTVLIKYFEKCYHRIRLLITSDDMESGGIVSAFWVFFEDITRLLSQNTLLFDNMEYKPEVNDFLSVEETTLEMRMKSERSFHRSELVFDYKKLASLASMHYSLNWLVAQVKLLREPSGVVASNGAMGSIAVNIDSGAKGMVGAATTGDKKTGSSDNLPGELQESWSMDSLPNLENEEDEKTYLPVPADLRPQYDALLTSYRSLSDTCLFTLHVELRCHSMYFLDLAVREGAYYLDDEAYEPDAYITALNQDLATCEEIFSSTLPERRVQFIFDGLSSLQSHILISNHKHLKRVNQHGMTKMIRNVLSLQQCLTNIAAANEKALDSARQYYELFALGGEGLIRSIEMNGVKYTEEEYKAMLELMYQETLAEASVLPISPSSTIVSQQPQQQQNASTSLLAPMSLISKLGGKSVVGSKQSISNSGSQGNIAGMASANSKTAVALRDYEKCLVRLRELFGR